MVIQVVAAIVRDADGTIMLARRKPHLHCGGYWEFPGGKVAPGESPQEALERELLEELAIHVVCGEFAGSQIHHYESKTVELAAYFCTIISGTIKLSDHDRLTWVSPENIGMFDLAPADRFLISLLQNLSK